MAKIQHISDSAHWYTQDGKPAYDATLREARKQRLIPSVTTYKKIIAKFAIDNWRINMFLQVAYLNPPTMGDMLSWDWIKRISDLAKPELEKAANRGTELHKMIEVYLTQGILPEDPVGQRACVEIALWEISNGYDEGALSEATFANLEEAVAGRVDRIYKGGILSDIKTTAKPPRKPWPEWAWQMGGYYLAANLPPKPSPFLVVNSLTGELTPHILPQEKVEEGIITFKSIRDAWMRIKKYDPRREVK